MLDVRTERRRNRTSAFTRIAVLDDDEAFLDAICEVLSVHGYSVRGFSKADKLFEMIRARTEFEVILVDLKLNGETGLDVFKKLKAFNVRSPVIFISGAADVPSAVEAIQEGAVHFVQKPFEESQLLDLIEKCASYAVENRNEDVEISEFIDRYNKLPQNHRFVMDLAVDGLTNKEIAARLKLSIRTVDTYRMWIMERMAVQSFAELVKKRTLMERRLKKSRVSTPS